MRSRPERIFRPAAPPYAEETVCADYDVARGTRFFHMASHIHKRGAADGWCDACAITGGEGTENEMFLLTGPYDIADGFPQPPSDGPVFAGAVSLR